MFKLDSVSVRARSGSGWRLWKLGPLARPTPRTRGRGKSPALMAGEGPKVLAQQFRHRRLRPYRPQALVDKGLRSSTSKRRANAFWARNHVYRSLPSRFRKYQRAAPAAFLRWGSADTGERPRGRDLGTGGIISSLSGQGERPRWSQGGAPHGAPVRLQHWRTRRNQWSKGSLQLTLGKDGSTDRGFTTAHTPRKGNLRAHGGGGGESRPFAESMLCSESRTRRTRHAQ